MESFYWLDIAFPNLKVYLEYDGSGHELGVKMGKLTKQEFDQREIVRSQILKRKGWKELRLISSTDKLPEKEKLIKIIEFCFENLLVENHSHISFNLDNLTYRYKNHSCHWAP